MSPTTTVKRDYYEVLSVSRTATEQEIKSAYRKVALQYHPDRTAHLQDGERKEAEEKFNEASEAYAVLMDVDKRAAYDRYGHAATSASGFGGFSGGADFGNFNDIFSSIFEQAFGGDFGGGTATRARRGADLRFDLKLAFEDAVFGKETEIKVRRAEPCEECSGSGVAAGKKAATCTTCNGRGQVRYQQGFFSMARTCPKCAGTGQIISDPCAKCAGQGAVRRERALTVNIPAGVEDGTQIRYRGQGEAGQFGGPSGDLFVILHVAEHPVFERDGEDLHCSVPISFTQAALGTELEIDLLRGGKQTIKVPAGTPSGHQFRVRGQGVPVLNGRGRGDLIVTTAVQIPTKLSKQQRQLLEELATTLEQNNEPHQRNLFSKVKDIFQ
ncbi:MAG: molecular chaperone DnaJ [Acidobacteriales bacterium]|nr:molecular chaperone DnaJ [Terriglobales bacterium]